MIRIKDVPEGFLAVLSGHIHRFQVLTEDLKGKSIDTPILYPGSIERTSFAEKDEPKGYLKIELRNHVVKERRMNTDEGNDQGKKRADALALDWEFMGLPARPMIRIDIQAQGLEAESLAEYIHHALKKLDPESVVKLHIIGQVNKNASAVLRARCIRGLSPSRMNISLRFHRGKGNSGTGKCEGYPLK